MNIDELKERQNKLQVEMQKTKQNINLLTENLENSKSHYNMLNGHINEITYLIEQIQNRESTEQSSMEYKEQEGWRS